MSNPYLPMPVRIESIRVETEDRTLRTFELSFLDDKDAQNFSYLPGQFAELSVAGYGEVPIGIASSPNEGDNLLFTVSRTGVVTTRLHEMSVGDVMGVRGPLGKPYPLLENKGKNIVIVAGGYAVTTLRSTMLWLLDASRRGDYGDIKFVYGARTPGMLLYEEQWRGWQECGEAECYITIDKPCEGWDCMVGFVPQAVEEAAPSPENAIALVCGPPAMIRFTQPVLEKLGWGADQIILSLENRMKCGIGICGRCNVGPHMVCKDGPVFTKAELDRLPKEY